MPQNGLLSMKNDTNFCYRSIINKKFELNINK
jgi:hypothetical protein